MTDAWVDDVLIRMRNLNQNGNDQQIKSLGDDIFNYINSQGEITKLVSGVDKVTGELVIGNISSF
ncbi:hypothetical protein [Psychroserpens damuponensis]|uniref:hypothetical protein n=1 Tax=Psychroserpens damuponensis TaxID=943936 RepID=UPI00058D32DA|nr:hypothetical protein [Psychroserpens damuponensis]